MALFLDSTQAQFWTMDEQAVASQRRTAHQSAVAARPTVDTAHMLSMHEEARIRDFHERRILRFVHQIRFPDKVAATAITYFKRYFLTRSVMDYNPSVIALCALYAAFKVEEVLMSADVLVSRVDVILNGVDEKADIQQVPYSIDGTAARVTSDTLLKIELPFLQQINFHLICYHPLRSLAIIRERLVLSPLFRATDDDATDRLGKLLNRASNVIMLRAMISDLPLSQPPGVIAVAATAVASAEMDGPSDGELLDVLVASGKHARVAVENAMHVLRSMGDRPPSGETDRVAAMEKRRRRVKNEENDPTTSGKFREHQLDKLAQEDLEEAQLGRNYQEKLKKRAADLLGFGQDDDEQDANGSARKRAKLDL